MQSQQLYTHSRVLRSNVNRDNNVILLLLHCWGGWGCLLLCSAAVNLVAGRGLARHHAVALVL
jgi:hypothetical protein